MPSQHSIEKGLSQEEGRRQAEEGILVPLELPEWRILKQEVQADGTIRVEVMGTNERAKCPHCDAVCVKRHDVRPRSKRDVPRIRASGRVGRVQTTVLVLALSQSVH